MTVRMRPTSEAGSQTRMRPDGIPCHVRKGEDVGGGYFVHRRGSIAGRIKPAPMPFEHPSLESALAERDRIQALYPHLVFCVFGEVA